MPWCERIIIGYGKDLDGCWECVCVCVSDDGGSGWRWKRLWVSFVADGVEFMALFCEIMKFDKFRPLSMAFDDPRRVSVTFVDFR